MNRSFRIAFATALLFIISAHCSFGQVGNGPGTDPGLETSQSTAPNAQGGGGGALVVTTGTLAIPAGSTGVTASVTLDTIHPLTLTRTARNDMPNFTTYSAY